MTRQLSVMLKVASFIVTVSAALFGVVLPVINVRLDVSNQSTYRPIPKAEYS
jgi:NhaP-type Na+/H+ and K+/H+ antiporter